MRFCAVSMLRISNAAGRAHGHRLRPPAGAPRRSKRRGVRQPFDAGLQLHERAEVGHARDAAGAHLAHRVGGGQRRPRIVQELLQPERDLLRGVVHPQHLHGDLVTRRDDLIGVDARPAHFGHMEQALDAAAQVHEGAELQHRCDPSGEHRARHDRLSHVCGAGALLLLEVFAPGDDHVLPAVLVLDDAKRVDAALRAPLGRWFGRCRSARADRTRARGRGAPRSRPSRLLPLCLPPRARPGTRPRVPAAWRHCCTPLRESTMPPLVETTIAWMRSPTDTSTSPSASFSSSRSISASPLPPTLTKATFGPNATMVPSMV